MNVKEYNGWTNYETWLVSLWQDNDQSDYNYWQEQAAECVKVDGKEDAVISLGDIMREHYREAAYERIGTTGFWCDLLEAALSEVNWREIAEHLIADVEVGEIEES